MHARLTDSSNLVSYIRSDRIVLDAVSPVISGVEDGKIYCQAQTVTVTEKYVDTVTVNSDPVLLDSSSQFLLSPAAGVQTIVVTDKAGNKAQLSVTVNSGHTAYHDDGDCTTPVSCQYCAAEVTAAKEHDFSGSWLYNETGHYHACLHDGCTKTDSVIGHSGQDDGDCTTAVVCQCGYVITPAQRTHTWNPWASTGSGSHSRKCTVSGCTAGVETDSCSGGTATCTEKATCEVCGSAYGPLDPQHHTGTLDWVQTSTTHEQKWTCCGTILVAQEAHQWENGICAQCGYGCAHTGGTATCHTKAVCTRCGNAYGEPDKSNHTGGTALDGDAPAACTENGYTGDVYCLGCGAVLTKGTAIAATGHTGGTATCRDKAVCQVCGETYGPLDTSRHTNLVHFPAKPATKSADGHVEYWFCDGCGKYFSDAAATKEIAQADVVLAKKPDDGQETPPTGDSYSFTLWLALLFVSGGALVTASRRRRHGK